MSDDDVGTRETPGQLPLFEGLNWSDPKLVALTAETARANVSPGWWPVVGPLWNDNRIAVTGCHEEHGILRLAIARVQDASASRLRDPRQRPKDGDHHQEDDDDQEEAQQQEQDADVDQDQDDELRLQALVEELVRLCAQTCACCGQRPAAMRAPAGREPARVLCDCCAEEIGRGIPLLVAADAYWRLDGARRAPRLIRLPEAKMPHAPTAGSGPVAPVPAVGRAVGGARHQRFDPLPAPELRTLVRSLRSAVAADITGQVEAVARLALVAALHVGGDLTHGQRTLIIGPSGVGKSSLVRALCGALAGAGYELPVVTVDAVELTSPGWSGAPTIHELLATPSRSVRMTRRGPGARWSRSTNCTTSGWRRART